MRRDEVLALEFDRALEAQRVRVVALSVADGDDCAGVLEALAARLRARRVDVDLVSAELVGAIPGGGLDAWLRRRLGLPPALTGAALAEALAPHLVGLEPSTAQCLRTLLGLEEWRLGSLAHENASRREAAAGELERWLLATGRPFALLVADAVGLDDETLAFLEHLARRERRGAALVLLTLRSAPLDPRSARRLQELREAHSLVDRALSAPSAWERARAGPPAQPLTPIDAEAERVSAVLRLGGGQLPMSALLRALGAEELERGLAALESRRLVARGPTRRFGGEDEVALRHRSESAAANALGGALERRLIERRLIEHLVEWAKEHVRPEEPEWPDRAPLVLSLLARGGALSDFSRAPEGPAGHDPAAPPLGPGSSEARPPVDLASLAHEAIAALDLRSSGALREALGTARGVRRLVLGRRLVDRLCSEGRLAEARGILAPLLAEERPEASTLATGWELVLFAAECSPLDRWDRLGAAEARAALALAEYELSAAESGRRSDDGETARALEQRLGGLGGEAGFSLGIRWTLGWARERLARGGDPAEIAARCRAARSVKGAGAAGASFAVLELLEVEELARSRCSAGEDARELVDLRITLSKARGDVRAECAAWRSRGLIALRSDRLDEAQLAFEASLKLAQGLSELSDQTMAWHELGVLQCELGEHTAALELHRTAVELIDRHGEAAGRCRAAAGLALAELGRLDLRASEVALARARRALEPDTNPMLRAWLRLLEGQRLVASFLREPDALVLARARHELSACIDVLEEHPFDGSELFEPVEAVAVAALTWRLSGQGARAKATLERGARLASGRPSAALWLEGARETLAGRRPDAALAGLEALRLRRAEELFEQLLHALGLTASSWGGTPG